MVWFVCKMHFWHMCTFALENLMVKGLSMVVLNSRDQQGNVWLPLLYNKNNQTRMNKNSKRE